MYYYQHLCKNLFITVISYLLLNNRNELIHIDLSINLQN